MKIALAGNPNAGKTTLFNTLTGSNQFVGNWPGVTVEKKEGKLKKLYRTNEMDKSNEAKEVSIVDLPGIYSLSPYTLEEVVARDYLLNEKPDLIIHIVDGTNLERNLYLTTQLIELGRPVMIMINRMDILEKEGTKINQKEIARQLGCETVAISALKETGIKEAIEKAVRIGEEKKEKQKKEKQKKQIFDKKIEVIIKKVEEKLDSSILEEEKRFFAIKLLEKDKKIVKNLLKVPDVLCEIKELEEIYEDDLESIIANGRYLFIDNMIKTCTSRMRSDKQSLSDRIDNIVTNRFLALPIFAAVMFFVYYISVTTVGAWVTDFTNDGLFGEGFSFFGFEIAGIPVLLEGALRAMGCATWLQGLLLDGIVGGVGAVLGFVPQMLILFAFLAFLESCGYMARVAFIMDRIFRKFGLSGKSFIPMLIGSGCGIPGIMASRTIENDKDRKMTIITTTFIPCGAKLPIIALIAGALFQGAWWVAPSAYFVGIAAIIGSGILLKKTKLFKGEVAPFVMELPSYHLPTIKNIWKSMWERGSSFIKKAGTVILLSAIVLWFLQGFGWMNGKIVLLEADQLNSSFLAGIGSVIAPLFLPLGWGNWEMAVATITGFIAKENVVTTFGVLFGFSEVAEDGIEIWGRLASSITPIAAYSFLVFNLLCAPCFAAIGAIKREMNSAKWTCFAIAYQTGLAYLVSFLIFQIGSLITTGFLSMGTIIVLLLLGSIVFMIIRSMVRNRKNGKSLHCGGGCKGCSGNCGH